VIEALVIAIAVGLDNFAASIGIGVAGIEASAKLRVAVVFGAFEALVPILGVLLGRRVAGVLGADAAWLGGALLVATGLYALIEARRSPEPRPDANLSTRRLLLVGAALSIDNLLVGLALGTSHVPIPFAIAAIGVVSVAMCIAGLELGQRLGRHVERFAGEIGAGVLILVGIAILAGAP
jgi:putative Mn2+ efflux pump MntP